MPSTEPVPACPAFLLPSEEWEREVVSTFVDLRQVRQQSSTQEEAWGRGCWEEWQSGKECRIGKGGQGRESERTRRCTRAARDRKGERKQKEACEIDARVDTRAGRESGKRRRATDECVCSLLAACLVTIHSTVTLEGIGECRRADVQMGGEKASGRDRDRDGDRQSDWGTEEKAIACLLGGLRLSHDSIYDAGRQRAG